MNGPATRLEVTFSKMLAGNPALDHTNWTCRWNDLVWTPSAAETVGPVVRIDGATGGADIGADVCSFAPPPFDVIDMITALTVAAFADYPVTA
jgi:hypothetical protein